MGTRVEIVEFAEAGGDGGEKVALRVARREVPRDVCRKLHLELEGCYDIPLRNVRQDLV